MTTLITGANGFIGRVLCDEAAKRELDIKVLLRPLTEYETYPASNDFALGALPYDLPIDLMSGIDSVIHLAGTTRGEDYNEAYAINVLGTEYLLRLFKKAKCTGRFIFVSSQSAKPTAVSAYGKTKFDAEQVVKNSGVPYIIIRPGLVVGYGDHGLFSRMTSVVKLCRFIPLPAGGRAIVQPVDVTTLSLALINALNLPLDRNYELNLGDPDGISLKDFLTVQSKQIAGRDLKKINIPLWPIKWGLTLFSFLHIPFPITLDNLRGLETVEKMPIGDAYEILGIKREPIMTVIRNACVKPNISSNDSTLPVKIMVVGAGKIGIVHSLNLKRRIGVSLAALVDTRKKALKLYKTMGIKTKYFTDLEQAMTVAKPDGVIIATPVKTHLKLVKLIKHHHLPILVEKPLALSRTMLDSFKELEDEEIIQVGYMAAQYPHLDRCVQMLSDKRLGKILGFRALALQSHIMSKKPVLWEMKKAEAGGGVILNFAGHLIAVLQRLLGVPNRVACNYWSIYSTEVEDAAEIAFYYPVFQGRIVTSWSISGYERPIYRVYFHFENGLVIFDNTSLSLMINDNLVETHKQEDYDSEVGFNLAPDYTGAGFAREHLNFVRTIIAPHQLKLPHENGMVEIPSQTPVGLSEAIKIETLIDEVYKHKQNDLRVDRYTVAKEIDASMDKLISDLRKQK